MIKKILIPIFCFTLLSCTPTLLFTEEQFVGYYSDTCIPQKWFGQWTTEEYYKKNYITKDSFSIGGLEYKLIKSELKLGIDSNKGHDKIIFQDDWCFFTKFNNFDTNKTLSGFQVLVGKIDNQGNINCWEMSYDYFLKNKLISKIPIIKYHYSNITTDGIYQKIEPHYVYADIPKEISMKTYNKLIKKLSISTEVAPYFCDNSYNFDFFKNIAQSRTPDLILTKDNKEINRLDNKNEKRFKRIGNRNSNKLYLQMLISK